MEGPFCHGFPKLGRGKRKIDTHDFDGRIPECRALKDRKEGLPALKLHPDAMPWCSECRKQAARRWQELRGWLEREKVACPPRFVQDMDDRYEIAVKVRALPLPPACMFARSLRLSLDAVVCRRR